MKKLRFIWIFLAVALAVSISNSAFAAEGTIDTFVVTIDQVDISRDGGRTWLTVNSGAKEFDMIDLRGGSASLWFSNVQVPAGTYNKWRVHILSWDATIKDITDEVYINNCIDLYGGEHDDYITAIDGGTTDEWDSGDMNVVVDANGNTTAIFNWVVKDGVDVQGPVNNTDIEPEITLE